MGLQSQKKRELRANKPDTILKNKVYKMCPLMTLQLPSDANARMKEFEKYKDLEKV